MTGRVALVTGGGRGIGRAISLALARDGFAVAVNYRKDRAAAEQTCDEIAAAGGTARAYQASVDSIEDSGALARDVLADFGQVDALICNAGIASRGNTLVDTDPAELERVLHTHLFGALHLVQLLVPQMRTLDRGDVVLMSSVATTRPSARGGPYMIAKLALEALGATLAVEELPHGIHTNMVAPGLVVTDMGDRLALAVTGAAEATELDAVSPYGRVCRPQDVADVVSYLVSPAASYVNGQRVAVDGGGSSFP